MGSSKDNGIQPQQSRAGSPVFTPTTFDTNIVIITAALFFVLICALGMNAIIKFVLNWTRNLSHQSQTDGSSRRPTAGINKTELKSLPTAIYHHKKEPSDDTKYRDAAAQLDVSNDHEFHTQDPQCIICLNEFEEGEKIRVLPLCNHGFHMKCVDAWLLNHSSCPTCRADLTPIITDHHHAMNPRYGQHIKQSTQVKLEILISPSGALTPTVYRVVNSSLSSSHSAPDSNES
ncbi:hypothetical protein KP509_10G008300 [Ceratopteris richardii]|nr:hypothetical protein KP509_10G008300 [Ceratopteris richardii]